MQGERPECNFLTWLKMYPFFFIILFLFAVCFADDADKRADMLGTVQVSRVHSLDDSKGRYKSPRRAMFMSLLVPGSGQFYVGGSSRYVRGTFYLAEEIALITGLYYHSVYKYDKQVKKYRTHANTHFIIETYEESMNRLFPYGIENVRAFQLHYGGERENYCTAIYGTAAGSSNSECIPFESGHSFHIRYYQPGMQLYNPSAFYRAIADKNFILGWEDVEANSNAGAAINEGEYVSLGKSEYYNKYISMRKKATDLADRQAIFLGAIILNHIVSAVDAALSAKAHNNSLYEEKVSFLDKIRLGSDLNMSEDFRVGAGLWYYF